MDIIAKKLSFVQEVLRISDENLLDKLEKFLRKERKKRIEKDLKPMSLLDFQEMIDNAEKDIKNDKITEARELLKSIDKWE